MEKNIFEELPLISRRELLNLRQIIDSIYSGNESILDYKTGNGILHRFIDYSGKYSFDIAFSGFDSKSNKNVYTVSFNPKSENRITGTSYQIPINQISDTFKIWVNLVINLNQATYEYFDPFGRFYNEQFYEYFTTNDPDAEENPFEIERQEILYLFLTIVEKKIEASVDLGGDDKKLLLSNVSSLKEDLPRLTKKRFVTELSKLAHKVKKLSNKVFHEIFDVLKKEAIKKMLEEAIDQLPKILDNIQNLLT